MRKRKYKKREKVVIHLTKKDKQFLTEFLNKGEGKARSFKRAKVLLELDESLKTTTMIGKDVNYYPMAIRQIGKRYIEGGIDRALFDKKRPGKAKTFNDGHVNQIIAMICSDPPEGYNRWTIELIAEESIKRKIVPTIGREFIRILLHSHNIKPWREKNVVYPDINKRIHRKNGSYTGLI
jgi:putative transposase